MVVGDENSLLIAESMVSSLEAVVKTLLEGVSIKETPTEKAQVTNAVGDPEKVSTVAAETGGVFEADFSYQMPSFDRFPSKSFTTGALCSVRGGES